MSKKGSFVFWIYAVLAAVANSWLVWYSHDLATETFGDLGFFVYVVILMFAGGGIAGQTLAFAEIERERSGSSAR